MASSFGDMILRLSGKAPLPMYSEGTVLLSSVMRRETRGGSLSGKKTNEVNTSFTYQTQYR